jgi:hypothetical protein
VIVGIGHSEEEYESESENGSLISSILYVDKERANDHACMERASDDDRWEVEGISLLVERVDDLVELEK